MAGLLDLASQYLQGVGDRRYSGMSWDDLYDLRNQYGRADPMQNVLAPMEHRAWARELVTEKPIRGAIGQAVLIPVYTAVKSNPTLAKLFDADKARSKPSWEEMKQAYIGIGEGLLGAMRK